MGQAYWGKPIGTRLYFFMQQEKWSVYSFNKKGVKNGAVAALASDYFLMVDRLILPMALKTMKEKVDPGTMPAGFLKENIINLNAQQIEKLKLKVPHKISRKANWILYNFVSTRSGLELKVPSDYAVLNTLLLF